MEKVGKNATTKMESSDIRRALPYLENGEKDGDRNLASVGERWKFSYLVFALPREKETGVETAANHAAAAKAILAAVLKEKVLETAEA